MTCPYCQNEMETGTFMSNGGNYFLPDGMKRPAFYTEAAMKRANAVLLPPNPYSTNPIAEERPRAVCCRECRIIMIGY